ncbi:mutator type transposase [Tanacetum coccineum]
MSVPLFSASVHTLFSISLHHGGSFTSSPGRSYINGQMHIVDELDSDEFSVYEIDSIVEELGQSSESAKDAGQINRGAKDAGQSSGGANDACQSSEGAKDVEPYVPSQCNSAFVNDFYSLFDLYVESQDPNFDPFADLDSILPTNTTHQAETNVGDKDDLVSEHSQGHGDDIEHRDDTEHSEGNEHSKGNEDTDSSDDSHDSDYIMDEENYVDDVDVDMEDLHYNIDETVEFMGSKNRDKTFDEEEIEEDVEVLNNDYFESDSDEENELDRLRKRKLKQIRKQAHASPQVYNTYFYVGQDFPNRDAVKEHSIETRRELRMEKNDKERVRVICKGVILSLPTNEPNGPADGSTNGPASPSKVKWTKSKIAEASGRTHELAVSKSKVFRAKAEAEKKLRGDYTTQYKMLRDYVLELQQSNPNTTVKIQVKSEADHTVPTRVFRRIYVCLGPLKDGFKAGMREILGLDEAFLKETENTDSWTWFLTQLGDDLDLYKNSNFTFISDRQKGIIPATAKLFPCAEHRFCVKHIHKNMKQKWKGATYKEHLWKCATSKSIEEFNVAMQEFKAFSLPAYEWLLKIPPQHWARSNFSGRCKSDMLVNNMCEVFNGKMLGGRDKAIISTLEFAREYLMKRIVNVNKMIARCDGPLTPTATKLLKRNSYEANKYTVKWGGGRLYWPKCNVPSILLPPEHQPQVGRPQKARRKSQLKRDVLKIDKSGKLTRNYKTVTCDKCGSKGHNSRTCTGPRNPQSQTGTRSDYADAVDKGKSVAVDDGSNKKKCQPRKKIINIG